MTTMRTRTLLAVLPLIALAPLAATGATAAEPAATATRTVASYSKSDPVGDTDPFGTPATKKQKPYADLTLNTYSVDTSTKRLYIKIRLGGVVAKRARPGFDQLVEVAGSMAQNKKINWTIISEVGKSGATKKAYWFEAGKSGSTKQMCPRKVTVDRNASEKYVTFSIPISCMPPGKSTIYTRAYAFATVPDPASGEGHVKRASSDEIDESLSFRIR